MTQIKCLRIHHETEQPEHIIYDRYGEFRKKYHQPIFIKNPPKIKYFGFCPIETDDITLEFETPIDSSQIKINRSE
jgi:hypothetical protein